MPSNKRFIKESKILVEQRLDPEIVKAKLKVPTKDDLIVEISKKMYKYRELPDKMKKIFYRS